MVDAPEKIWAFHDGPMVGLFIGKKETGTNISEYIRADLVAHTVEENLILERQIAELRAEWDTLAMHLEAKAILAKRDNARLREALSGACDQILDSYRTWVADDLEAHPKQGQIPRYDAARAALAQEGRNG